MVASARASARLPDLCRCQGKQKAPASRGCRGPGGRPHGLVDGHRRWRRQEAGQLGAEAGEEVGGTVLLECCRRLPVLEHDGVLLAASDPLQVRWQAGLRITCARARATVSSNSTARPGFTVSAATTLMLIRCPFREPSGVRPGERERSDHRVRRPAPVGRAAFGRVGVFERADTAARACFEEFRGVLPEVGLVGGRDLRPDSASRVDSALNPLTEGVVHGTLNLNPNSSTRLASP